MSLQSWCQNHTIPPMKEDWMEWYMNINKLMRMIINKMKGYLKDDQLGFKYQKSLHKEIKYEWTNDTVSICLPAWVRLDSASPVWSTCIKLTALYMYLQGSFILWAAQHQQMHNDITQLKHLGFNLLLKYYVKYLHQIDSSISMVSRCCEVHSSNKCTRYHAANTWALICCVLSDLPLHQTYTPLQTAYYSAHERFALSFCEHEDGK